MPTLTENIAVNNNAGAFTAVSAKQFSRKVTIQEDPVNAPGGVLQGLQYQLASENFAIIHQMAAGEILTLGDTVAFGHGIGPLVGGPAQNAGQFNAIPATVYAKVRSLTATATAIRVQEMD